MAQPSGLGLVCWSDFQCELLCGLNHMVEAYDMIVDFTS